MMRVSLLAVLVLAGCPRKVPEHLRVAPPPPTTEQAQRTLQTLDDAIAALVGADPLVRSASLPDLDALMAIEGSAPLVEFVEQVKALEQGDGQAERSMQQLEESWPTSVVVALSRGYRLRVTENLLGNMALPVGQRDTAILALVTPLQAAPDGAALNRGPLDWLVLDGETEPIVRSYAERWVLQGWLSDPGVRLDAAAEALQADMYDGLARTPTAALLLARNADAAGPSESGLAKLERSARLALVQAAADRDREQAAWSDRRKEAAEELGVDDPIHHLLSEAVTELTAAAGDDEAAGGALLALAAMRWRGSCDDSPCRGLDRVATMATARRYGPRVDAVGQLWQVIALKEALDTMEVAHDTVMYPEGSLALVDAVLGTGGGPLDDQVLRKRRPDAGVWLAVARAVGEEGVTAWEGARAALGQHLKNEADDARQGVDDEEIASLLERISARAIP